MTDTADTVAVTDVMGNWLILIAVVGLLLGLLWWAFLQTYHFAEVHAGVLYRGGNRGIREFAHAIRKGRIKTVVSLVDDSELADHEKPEFAAEMEWCRLHGVHTERIPIPLGGWPSSEDVRRFCQFVSDAQNQPVMVHCAQGVRRTGMMVAAYQQSVLGWDDQKCRTALLTFGHSQRTVGDVQKFIDVYDPKTGTVPTDLPPGKE